MSNLPTAAELIAEWNEYLDGQDGTPEEAIGFVRGFIYVCWPAAEAIELELWSRGEALLRKIAKTDLEAIAELGDLAGKLDCTLTNEAVAFLLEVDAARVGGTSANGATAQESNQQKAKE